ncbi:chitin-binding domain-containing protein [Nocardia sp. NPDC006630]|uniref:chitin-binding domain-containing protein n=1 Tax=Nocardia sp. NPDC006630 TaxID=3157181 RepID=UPI00339E8928
MAKLTPQQQATLDSWRPVVCNSNGDSLPNPDDAHSFYVCDSAGAPALQSCPMEDALNKQVYSPELGTCVSPRDVSVDENPAPRAEFQAMPSKSAPDAPGVGIIRPGSRDVGY